VRYFVPLALEGAAEVARIVEPGRPSSDEPRTENS
jgi:hypothetical protein